MVSAQRAIYRSFKGPHSHLGGVIADITAHLGPECYSGVVFFASPAFLTWRTEIFHPWFAELLFRIISNDPSDSPKISRDFVEAFAFSPEKIHPTVKLAWVGAYALQSHAVKMKHLDRIQDEGPLKSVVKGIPALLLMGKEDKFLSPEKMEKLFRETFGDEAEVQIWPEVGHLPFFEEPEKTRDAILGFVKRVKKVRLSFRVSLIELIAS